MVCVGGRKAGLSACVCARTLLRLAPRKQCPPVLAPFIACPPSAREDAAAARAQRVSGHRQRGRSARRGAGGAEPHRAGRHAQRGGEADGGHAAQAGGHKPPGTASKAARAVRWWYRCFSCIALWLYRCFAFLHFFGCDDVVHSLLWLH